MAWVLKEVEATSRSTGDDWTFRNVYPSFGREHDMTPACWCEPEWDDEQDHNAMLVHRGSH